MSHMGLSSDKGLHARYPVVTGIHYLFGMSRDVGGVKRTCGRSTKILQTGDAGLHHHYSCRGCVRLSQTTLFSAIHFAHCGIQVEKEADMTLYVWFAVAAVALRRDGGTYG
jgi:hypothetical protein